MRPIRNLLLIVAIALVCAVDGAEAYIPHRGVAAPVTGPVLASVTNTFGNLTLSGYGDERLSRTDQNYGAKFGPYGTGVLVSGSCPKWSTAVLSGNASYWNTISHVAEGAGAVTPTLTALGVTNQAGGAGTTTSFTVSCEDASNNVLATSVLTYAIVDGDNHCGAVNIGSTDNTGVAYFPSGFGSSVDGCYVLMSTGYNKTARFILGMPFTKKVYLTFADPARPGELQNIETGSNSTNAFMKDIRVTPNHTNGVGNAAFVLNGTNVSGDNLHAYATAAMRALGSAQCIQTNGTASTPQSVTNFGCDQFGGFFSPANNYTYQYFWSRHANADAIKTSNGYTHDWHVKDGIVMSFTLPDAGTHPDSFQISDGSTPWDFSVERLMVLQGGGDDGNQGPFFGGGPTGNGNTFLGYVGDCAGGAGQKLCVTSGGMQTNGNGAQIYSTAGSPVGISDGITVNCGGTPCPTGAGTQYTLIGLPGNVTLGSAASPVNFYGVQSKNATWDMIWSSGFVVQGTWSVSTAGTSAIRHFSHMYQTVSGITPTGPPALKFLNCQTNPLWTGTLTVELGAEYSTWNSDCAVTTNPPVNTTVTNVLSANSNTTTLGNWYANGNPKTCLEAKSQSDWDALSVQQAMVYAASCTVPKVGGPLDLGSGVYAGPQTTASTPTWADGTVVGTGFTGQ